MTEHMKRTKIVCVCVCACACGQVEPIHLWSGSVDDSREMNEKQAKEQEESLATLDVMTKIIATALPQ